MSEYSYVTKASPRRWTARLWYPAASPTPTYQGDIEEFEVDAADIGEARILAEIQAKDEYSDGWNNLEVVPYVPELIVMHW